MLLARLSCQFNVNVSPDSHQTVTKSKMLAGIRLPWTKHGRASQDSRLAGHFMSVRPARCSIAQAGPALRPSEVRSRQVGEELNRSAT
jgi:hypothetical protein